MARQRRFVITGLTQHVIQRGNNRADMFRQPSDYEAFLRLLWCKATRHQLDIHAFVLMTNHVHIMVTPTLKTSISGTIQGLGVAYVQYFNQKYARTGGLFEGRYRSTLVDSEPYWFNCMRYVELNPVRAGLVPQPEMYEWSSYSVHALGRGHHGLVDHPLYLQLGRTAAQRRQCWRTICQPLADQELSEIRTATHRRRALGPVILTDSPQNTVQS